jgi:phosphoglycolate phosphatase
MAEAVAAAPRAILYDWDNTLVDGWAGIAGALNTTFDAFGLPRWSVEDTRRRVRTSLRESFPALFGPDWQRARELFHRAMTELHLQYLRPMGGAAALLRAGAGRPQGLVSNKNGRYLRAEVAYLGWDAHFGAIVGAGDAAADKPDPAPILLALERLGLVADPSVWYAGDTASDMQAARAAGLTAVLVGDAAHDGGLDAAGHDLHFSTLPELARALLGP